MQSRLVLNQQSSCPIFSTVGIIWLHIWVNRYHFNALFIILQCGSIQHFTCVNFKVFTLFCFCPCETHCCSFCSEPDLHTGVPHSGQIGTNLHSLKLFWIGIYLLFFENYVPILQWFKDFLHQMEILGTQCAKKPYQNSLN